MSPGYPSMGESSMVGTLYDVVYSVSSWETIMDDDLQS